MRIIKNKQNKKISKAITTGIAKLNNYSSTNTTSQHKTNTINHLYIIRDIFNIKRAISAK